MPIIFQLLFPKPFTTSLYVHFSEPDRAKQNKEMEPSYQDKNYIESVISSVKSSFSGSNIDQELLIKLEQKWIEKLKIIDEEAEKAAGNLLI